MQSWMRCWGWVHSLRLRPRPWLPARMLQGSLPRNLLKTGWMGCNECMNLRQDPPPEEEEKKIISPAYARACILCKLSAGAAGRSGAGRRVGTKSLGARCCSLFTRIGAHCDHRSCPVWTASRSVLAQTASLPAQNR